MSDQLCKGFCKHGSDVVKDDETRATYDAHQVLMTWLPVVQVVSH